MGKRKYPEIEIGTRMKDGTIYAGLSPTTLRPMFAAAANATPLLTFDEAKDYARNLTLGGRTDWRVPTEAELAMLFWYKAEIGGFERADTFEGNWYRSATRHESFGAWSLYAAGPGWANTPDGMKLALRCVCG